VETLRGRAVEMIHAQPVVSLGWRRLVRLRAFVEALYFVIAAFLARPPIQLGPMDQGRVER
jgi:hypothetical protein